MKKGRQFSSRPKDVAKKTARQRSSGTAVAKQSEATEAELLNQARLLGIEGRSAMRKAELQKAVHSVKK
jgi:hypothetical protein